MPKHEWVDGLKFKHVVFTGTAYLDGTHVVRAQCERRAKREGAIPQQDVTSETDVVVWGKLNSRTVTDAKRNLSAKLLKVESAERHIDVISADGFAELLAGRYAECLRHTLRGNKVTFSERDRDALHFGGPLKIHEAARHNTAELNLDLNKLDVGTEAHQKTLKLLQAHLKKAGITIRGPASSAPRFDAGWRTHKQTWIAEVKSITATTETQQVRLGLGQLLEYRARWNGERLPRAALVLSRRPSDRYWQKVCRLADVVLTWPPHFEGIT